MCKDCREEYDIIELTDEDGGVTEYAVVGVIEVDDSEYAILISPEECGKEEVDEAIILRIEQDEETGEDILVGIDSEEEFNRVAAEYESLVGDTELN